MLSMLLKKVIQRTDLNISEHFVSDDVIYQN